MRTNSLRNKLNANEISVCTRIFNPDAVSVEMLGQAGQFDYVEFVAEYGSFDLHDLDTVCRTAELYGLGSMIKIDQSHQGSWPSAASAPASKRSCSPTAVPPPTYVSA